VIFVILLYALFATVFPLCKVAFTYYISPLFFTGCCLVLAGTVLLAYVYATDKKSLRLKSEYIKPLAMLIVCNIFLTNVCERWGLQYLSSVKTAFIYNLSPFFSAIFSYFLLSEFMTLKKWCGLCVGFLGFIPYFIEKSTTECGSGSFLCFSWAELALVTASISTVIGWIGMRTLVLRGGSCLVGNCVSMLVGGCLILVASVYTESWNPVPVRDIKHALIYIILTTCISYLIAYTMYGSLLTRYTATFMTMAGLTSPLFTALFGRLLLGESVSWTFFFSMIMVGIGLTIFHTQEIKGT
jgi:drug/metabolite transporter (DMT)-like permease